MYIILRYNQNNTVEAEARGSNTRSQSMGLSFCKCHDSLLSLRRLSPQQATAEHNEGEGLT